MYQFDVNPALLLALVAGALALIFDYFPVVSKWFDTLEESQKKLLNVGLVVGVAVVLFVGDCLALFDTNLVCTLKGGLDLAYMVFLAITVNYGLHKATKPSDTLKARMFKRPVG